jgi:hypothetical protein
MNRNRQTKSLSQVLNEVDNLDKKCKRIAQLLGYRSSEIPKTYRQFISLCNSLSIVFLQFNLNQQSFNILNRAVQCDVSMFFEGSIEDRTWFGRALLYCNLGYLMIQINDTPSSLKFLYDAESLLLEIREMSSEVDYNVEDLTLAHASLTFAILCKIGRVSNAQKYLDIAVSQYNSIARKARNTRLNKTGIANLYCLLIPALKILHSHEEKKMILASEVAREILLKVNEVDIAGALLLQKYINTADEGLEMINSEEYRNILFVTSFFPFISNTTPVIDFEELIFEQERTKDLPLNLSDFLNTHSLSEDQDLYSLLMQEALSNVKNNH